MVKANAPFPPALSDLPSGRRSGLWAWAPSRNLKRDSEDGQANAPHPPRAAELLSGWLLLFWDRALGRHARLISGSVQ